jgi:hypothetical protein
LIENGRYFIYFNAERTVEFVDFGRQTPTPQAEFVDLMACEGLTIER